MTEKWSDKIKTGMGMGTFWSNTFDIPGHKPVPQVCKMTWANGHPTCKLSADASKAQCEDVDMLIWTKRVAQEY